MEGSVSWSAATVIGNPTMIAVKAGDIEWYMTVEGFARYCEATEAEIWIAINERRRAEADEMLKAVWYERHLDVAPAE